MINLSLSEKTEAQMLLEAGATNQHLVSMLEGVTITLRGLKHGPEGWTVAPMVQHIIRDVEPALAAARLEKSARVLRLCCAARGIEVS
jgi:hypothetical protein